MTASDVLRADESGQDAPAATRRARRLPLAVWAVVLLQVAFMFGATVLYPSFQNPDEPAHVDYILAHRHGHWIYAPGERSYQGGVLLATGLVPNTQFQTHVGRRPVKPRDQRPSFDQLGTFAATDRPPNQMVQHPSLYYGFAAGLSFLIPGFTHQHFDVQVFWLRMISLLLLVPVPILIFLTARRLTGDNIIGIVAALIPLTIPGFIRTGASVTNDSMAVLMGSVLLYLLARVATGDLSRSMAVWTGLAWAGGLLTKGLALAMPPVIVAAYLVGASGSLRERIRGAFRPALLCGAVGAVVGGWWWVRNLIAYGAVQPNGLGPIYSQHQFGPDRPGGTDLKFIEHFIRLFSTRAWGSLGLLDIPAMPPQIPVLIELVFLALVGVGVAVGLRRSPAPRWAAAAFILPIVVTLAVLYLGMRHWYLTTQKLPGLQVRYLFPLIAGMTTLAALGLRRLAGRLSRWLPLAVALFAVLFQLAAAAVVLDIEMSPNVPGRWRRIKDGLHYVLGWAPWRQPVTDSILVLGGVLTVGALAFLVATAIRNPVAPLGLARAGAHGEAAPEPSHG